MARRAPVSSGSSTCSSGSPATGRIEIRGPVTSVSAEETSTSTSLPSSVHSTRRSVSPSICGLIATVVACVAVMAVCRVSDVPTIGTPNRSNPPRSGESWLCRPGERSSTTPTTDQPDVGSRWASRTNAAAESPAPTTSTRCRQRPARRIRCR